MRFKRSSGILLHPVSFPGRFGIGDLGDAAYKFVDFLANSGQSLWQIMPLGPTGYGDSPYSSFSAFAGNTLLVSPERLVGDGLLNKGDVENVPAFATERVEYGEVIDYKRTLLGKAYENFKRQHDEQRRADYDGFLQSAAAWLDDYAVFSTLKDEHQGASWHTWPRGLAHREQGALAARASFRDRIEAHKFFQYLFFQQWRELKKYCREKGIRIIGDMPIFVAHNSADVWAHPELFKLHEDGSPIVVAGVPPDAFSKTGQRWGNPIYDWERMRAEGFRWWIERLRAALTTVDVVRIDHFRGFAATWEVPAEHDTAEDGQWVEVPGRALFNALKNSVGEVPIIAEDLGMLTPDVHALRDECGFPGMRVLQFAFNGDPCDTHLPHNYIQHTVVYTGTHDNDTVVGWFESRPAAERAGPDELMGNERAYSLEYLHSTGEEIHWDFICAAFASVADQAIIPLQDLLGLGASARMNVPASTAGNWAWRYSAEALTEELGRRLQRLTQLYGRLPAP